MIIGFDLSTKWLGMAITDNDGVRLRSEEFKLSGKDFQERLIAAVQIISNLVDAYSTHRFAIEAPFCGLNGKTTLELGKICGAVHGIVGAETGEGVIEVTPAEVKRAMTGQGNASKELMMQLARARYALAVVGEHEADALGVCLAAGMKLRQLELERRAE